VTFGHGLDHVVRWYLERRETRDTALITYTHDVRKRINLRVKQLRGASYARIAVGDRLLARVNAGHLDVMNGDVFTVTGIERADSTRTDWLSVEVAERTDPILVNLDLFEQHPSAFWQWRNREGAHIRELPFVHVWGGEALTVHVAQGSQWDDVGFVWCDTLTRMRQRANRRDEARRLLYTAVTRAAENLVIFAL
jgi:ATP-dependent exoDNAse (exonuclease V) alpha subunit